MKKRFLLVLVTLSVFLLTACSQNPFSILPDTELLKSDTLSFDYYNGKTTKNLFEYTFSQEYYFFFGVLDGNYRFTAINNYQDISNEFITFLDYYDEYIVFDKFINESYGDELRLSLGATDGDFNLTNISVDDDVYDVDAFISIENGLRIIFSYTEFYHEGEQIIIPYYFSITAYDMHEAYLKEYLPVENDYADEKAILIKYITHIIPLPPKVGLWPSSFDEKDDDLADLGHFTKLIKDTGNNLIRTEEVCTNDVTENCFEREYSILSGFIYEYSISEIVAFYELNYGGIYDGDNFIFFINGESYKISLAETTININYDGRESQLEDVITFEITKYDN